MGGKFEGINMKHAYGEVYPHGVRIGESVGLVCMEREG